MAELMFIRNAQHVLCSSYYRDSLRFDYISSAVLFRFPDSTRDVLTFFGLYKFAFWLGTERELTVLTIRRVSKLD